MRIWLFLLALSITFLPLISLSQNIDSLTNSLDSLKKQADTTNQVNKTEPYFYNERTKMNGRVFGILLWNDLKQQAVSPLDIKGRGWWTGLTLVGTTVGLSFLDKPIQRWAAGRRRANPTLGEYSKTVSDVGGVYEVASFAGIATAGFVFKNPKLRTTTALATQAYITSTIWSTLFKFASGRHRPYSINEGEEALNVSSFHGPFYGVPYGGNSAFPSGHTTLAFAAARVYAMEYKHIPAIPIISYTVAGLIGFSRIIENRHWATDVFAGAVLGYVCGTQVVNNYHRYARLQRQKQMKKIKKTSYNLIVDYYRGNIMPKLVVNL